ncbi:MAG: GspE/PulE family protein, partial [Gemmatimonadota bacterium]
MSERRQLLGQELVSQGALGQDALESVLAQGVSSGERLGETLIGLGLVGAEDVGAALAAQLGLPVAPSPLPSCADSRALLSHDFAQSRSVMPIGSDGRSVRLAMADPLDLRSIDDVRFITGRRVDVWVSTPAEVRRAHESAEEDDPARRAAIVSDRATAPAVRLVDALLRSAIERGASDVHIEESADGVHARARIDGRLEVIQELPDHARRTVLSRIKVLAQLDIADRRSAQDGRVPFEHGGKRLSLRISTLPVIGGEKAVVRILDASNAPTSLSTLGIDATDLTRLRVVLKRGEGVLLAAGPTGSGKSTTLFAALSELDRESRNVVTIEDPVEYRLPGANQIQVDPRAGLGFAAALRSVLRQDPDIVMVGEIRDRETAEIAMAAAITGHLVLSTIHANDAPGAMT